MARILFIQRLNCDYLGITSIAGVLKNAGHKCDVVITTVDRDINAEIKKFKPAVIGLPITAGELKWAIGLLHEIKKEFETINIVGGAEATICPEIIEYKGIDIVCRGEGEYPLLELLNKLDEEKSISNIQNLWVKRNGHVVKNDIRPLIQNLDILPSPDYEIYYKYPSIKNYPVRNFIFVRGCPFKCSYCHNHIVAEIYRGKGNYIRFKSPDAAVEEIREVVKNYKTRLVRLWDDTFTINRQWLKKFLNLYKDKVNLPFYCTIDITNADEEMIAQLKSSGCYVLEFGIESGNEGIRAKVLNRQDISNEKIVNISKMIRRYGINIVTQNMLGLPDETLEKAWQTIQMNAKVKPLYPFSTVFQPYPRLALTRYSIEKKMLDENKIALYENVTYFGRSPLNIPDIRQMERLQKIFILAVSLPWLKPLFNIIIRLPLERFLLLIHIIFNGICYKRSHRLTIFDITTRGLYLAKAYFLTKR